MQLSLSGSATIVSDYRFRGVSQSGKEGSGVGAYWEWSLRLNRDFGPISARLSYIDTDLLKGLNACATLVASLSRMRSWPIGTRCRSH